MGLERITMVLQQVNTIFDTDMFTFLIRSIEITDMPYQDHVVHYRIIVDHIRAATFLISEGVIPTNSERGYIVRNLLRRAFVHAHLCKLSSDFYCALVKAICQYYAVHYSFISLEMILQTIEEESAVFMKAFIKGKKAFDALGEQVRASTLPLISGKDLFDLHQTYGFRLELMIDLAHEAQIQIDTDGFWDAYKKHQEVSRVGQEKKFGGHGLFLQTGELKIVDETELQKVTRLHTATHLLQAALRRVLGNEVHQKGSDITVERLRFDFSYPRKLTDAEKKQVTDIVNTQIQKASAVTCQEMSLSEAEKTGALMFQKEKYGTQVTVYTMGDFSQELCGGPHVQNTKELGTFVILKEEASSAGRTTHSRNGSIK